MERSLRAFILAGTGAVILTVVVLNVFAAAQGVAWWMPLNATSHGIHGPEAVAEVRLDWQHTGLGALIHVLSCFFWALVGLFLLFLLYRGGSSGRGAPWIAGLATAALAGVVDYGVMPARLTPGWELVLNWQGVVAGLVALGIGLALGLSAARNSVTPKSPSIPPS